jgi:uncharacterized protein (DUF983 family)
MNVVAGSSFFTSFSRGLRGRCPHCGHGKLFRAYLKVNAACPACGHDLDQYPADDGPAYFTILLVGHLVVGPMLFFPIFWTADPRIVVPAALAWLLLVVLVSLPLVKGAFIGTLYHLRVTRQDAAIHTADQADV